MSREPDIVVSDIFVNKNQNQNARNKNAEQGVAPKGNCAVRKSLYQKVYKKNYSGEEKRNQQKIKIHISILQSGF